MDKAAADKFAEILEAAPSIYSDPPNLKAGESAFRNSAYNGIYDCGDGFGREYGKPASKGGRYMTLTDLRMMYYLGVESGKRMLYGWKPYWDKNFCNAIGGYPKGAIIRHSNGRKMVSRIDNNRQPLPDNYETNRYWGMVKATQKWGGGYGGDGGYQSVRIPLNFIPPTEPTTKVYCVPYDIDSSQYAEHRKEGLYYFPLWYYARPAKYWFETPLCNKGNLEVRLSRYDDIYTNATHAENYITIGKFREIAININISRMVMSISRLIPLAPGRWYFYFDYQNGCTTLDSRFYGKYERDFSLVCYKYSRNIVWPHF